MQFAFELYVNRQRWRRRSHFRKFRFLKRFFIRSETEWEAHKWEIGFKDYGLRRLESLVGAHGWVVERRDFTAGCRSVFLVCRNRGVD